MTLTPAGKSFYFVGGTAAGRPRNRARFPLYGAMEDVE